jgi:tRNA (guanine-N7-)-methyltransferase
MKTGPWPPLESTWEDWLLGGGPRAAFADPTLPLEVEIGPGEDDFLLESALAHPDRNWLGIEYSRKRVHRYVRRTKERAGELENLRLAWRPAADVVGPFLAPAQVTTYHVYFPDPWPKKHHHRYRLLHPSFLADVRDSLVPGGEMHMCSDHLEYVAETLEAFSAIEGLENVLPDPGWRTLEEGVIDSVFEERWRAQGRSIHRLHFRRGGTV